MVDFHIGGAPEGFDAQIVADRVGKTDGPVLWVLRDAARMAASRDALGFFAPELPVLEFPAWDCVAYDRTSPSPEIGAQRVATLAALAKGFDRQAVILTTLNAMIQRVPPAEAITSNSFSARVGDRVDVEALRGYLARTGFSQCPMVVEPGDFAIRGGLIDIYPPGADGPIRLDFFGDILDGARQFDAASQRTTRTVDRLELAAAQEFVLDDASITRFRQNYRIAFGAAGTDDPLYEAISAGRKHQGMEHWLPFFHEKMATLLDYLPDVPVMLDDRFGASHDARWDAVSDQYEARVEALKARSGFETVYKPAEPDGLARPSGSASVTAAATDRAGCHRCGRSGWSQFCARAAVRRSQLV